MTTFVCSTLAVQDKLMAIVYHFFFTYGYAMAMRFRTRITSWKKKRERTTCCTQCLKASNSLRHRSLCTSWYRDAIHWPYAVAWVEQDAMPRAKSATPLACPLFIWQLSEELLQFPEFPWSFRFFVRTIGNYASWEVLQVPFIFHYTCVPGNSTLRLGTFVLLGST